MCCVTPGSFRLVKSPLCSLNVSLPPLWFSANDTDWWPQELGFLDFQRCGQMGGCFSTSLGLGSSGSQEKSGVFWVEPCVDPPRSG